MIIACQPILRPKWARQPRLDGSGKPVVGPDGNPVQTLVPVLDADGGQQLVPTMTRHQFPWACGPDNSQISKKAWLSLTKGWDDQSNPVAGTVWFIGTQGAGDGTGKPVYLRSLPFTLHMDVRQWDWEGDIPDNTDKISIELAPHYYTVYASLEVEAR